LPPSFSSEPISSSISSSESAFRISGRLSVMRPVTPSCEARIVSDADEIAATANYASAIVVRRPFAATDEPTGMLNG
jgi:hypothetical protein